MRYVVLAQSEARGRVLADGWCRLLGLPNLEAMVGKPIVFDPELHYSGNVDRIFGYLCGEIEDRLASSVVDQNSNVTVLVDAIDADDLSLAKEGTHWSSLIGMLVTAFPELNWVFGFSGRGSSEGNFPEACHNRYSIFGVERYPLFDPTGLRDWIRVKTNVDLEQMAKNAGARDRDEAFQLPLRKQSAAVIEDEFDYATMHGYAAYRFGFRTDVVTSWRQMEVLFDVQSPRGPSHNEENTLAKLTSDERHKYRVILEDMRLQFPDKPASVHLSNPEDRAKHCNRLADENDRSDFRFMISTGQESASDDLWGLNEGHLYNKTYGIGKLLPKPIGGPLELWTTTGLNTLLENGLAEGFVSPPSQFSDEQYDGHGAPGKLALVARTLIDRARRVAANADTPQGFILSAVLANDAFELLGGKTPTMSLEALKLKHVGEIRAECAFVGVGFHAELDDRFHEIDLYVKSVCRWYQPNERKWCEWDAKATIYNEFVKIYRDAGQMEEEDKCLREFRWYNRRLELSQSVSKMNPIRVVSNGLLWYAEFLLGSLPRILFAFFAWWMVFILIQGWTDTVSVNPVFYLARQLNWMVGGGAYDYTDLDAGEDPDWGMATITVFANVIGVLHFGVLMSYLYSLISRK